MRRYRSFVIAICAVLSLGATACSSGGGTTESPSTARPTEIPTGTGVNACLLSRAELNELTGRTIDPKPVKFTPNVQQKRECQYFGAQDDDGMITTYVDDRPGGTLWTHTKQLSVNNGDTHEAIQGVGDEAYIVRDRKSVNFRKGKTIVTIAFQWLTDDSTLIPTLRAVGLRAATHVPS